MIVESDLKIRTRFTFQLSVVLCGVGIPIFNIQFG